MSEIRDRIYKILRESKISFMEDIEIQPNLFGGENTYYKDGRQAVGFTDVLKFMTEIAPDLSYTGDKQTKDLYWMIYDPSSSGVTIDSNKVADIESKLAERFGDGVVTVRLANSQYAPEIKRICVGFVDKVDVEDAAIDSTLEEGWKDTLKKGAATLGVAGALAGNAMAHDPMYDGATRPFDDTNMIVQQVQRLSDEDKKAVRLPNGMIKDQYGNEWSQEDWSKLMKGEDPFDDNDEMDPHE